MQLNALNEEINQYISFLNTGNGTQYLYLWESLERWNKEIILTQEGFIPSLTKATDNSLSRRMWKAECENPTSFLIEFFNIDALMTLSMMKNLQQCEVNKAEDTYNKFQFLSDVLFEEYRELHPTSIQTSHLQSPEVITKYLAHFQPERYSIYNLKVFNLFLARVNAKNIAEYEDYSRYLKVCNITHKLLRENKKLHLTLLKTDFYKFTTSIPMHFYLLQWVNAGLQI